LFLFHPNGTFAFAVDVPTLITPETPAGMSMRSVGWPPNVTFVSTAIDTEAVLSVLHHAVLFVGSTGTAALMETGGDATPPPTSAATWVDESVA
jgi:hypothetical protein